MRTGTGGGSSNGFGGLGATCWVLAICLPLVFGAIPIYLLDGVLKEVRSDISTWSLRAEDLKIKANSYTEEISILTQQINESKEQLQTHTRKSEEAGRELRHLHELECSLAAMESHHQAAVKGVRQRVEMEVESKLQDMQVVAQREAQEAVAEQRRLEAYAPQYVARIQELSRELRERKIEVEVGRALVDNDRVFLKAFIGRLTAGVDSYSGSYMLNAANCPPIGKPLMLPKTLGQEDSLGMVTADLLDVLPKMDPFIKPSRVVYKSCAVVGSSGLLLFSKHGAAIDSHDAVIRFNAAPTVGFEEFVGSKTTVRFVNRLHFGFQEKTSETVMQQVTTPETLVKFVELKREMPAQRYFIVSPEFHRFVVSQMVKVPTNGLYGLLFALQRCHQITLLGFYRGSEAHVPYHYFDTDAPVGNQRKRDVSEWPLILDIIRKSNGRVTLLDPCLTPEEQSGEAECSHCPPGGMCQPGRSLPVAKPGYCMESGIADCFYDCHNPSDCMGSANGTLCGVLPHSAECATY